MGQYTKYAMYKLQRRRPGTEWEDVLPLVLSIDGNGTQPLVVIQEDSPECGYNPPVEPIFRNIQDGTVCLGCDD